MPETNTVQGATQAPAQDAPASDLLDDILSKQGASSIIDDLEQEESPENAEATEQEERKLNALLRKAEQAFCKGNKGLLLSRVECGKWCHEIYLLRQDEGHKDRDFTSTLIFNRLAVHADSKDDADADKLALMYKTVELLAPEGTGKDAPWKRLTVGKLTALTKLIQRVDGAELYGVFDTAKAEQCKGLFAWACGEGLKKPSKDDIISRVLELKDPKKYAEREQQKAAKAADKAQQGKDAQDEDSADETPAPTNLIPTDTTPRAAPSWKDVGEGMAALVKEAVKQAPDQIDDVRAEFVSKLAALPVADTVAWMTAFFREGCKRNPGKAHEILSGFAKLVAWTVPAGKGFIDGIANSADPKSGEETLQAMVDTIADEYSIYPASELEEAA
jgi:hypothetical protein